MPKPRLRNAQRFPITVFSPKRSYPQERSGKDMIRAIFDKDSIAEGQFSNLPRAVWHHLLQRVDERQVSRGFVGAPGVGADWTGCS